MEKQKAQSPIKRRISLGKGVIQVAKSPAHRFGQFIGELLEKTLIRYCTPIAEEYHMYLDYRHPRPAREGKNEVQWVDINGNKHKLDIVIEENGSEDCVGSPRAFIEIAWRRYTKHSKNKAQEISGAIRPLILRYFNSKPFYGAVLAGDFTENSLAQMRSEGFELLYFSRDMIEQAFFEQSVDAHWDEDTSESDLEERVVQAEALQEKQLQAIGDYLMAENQGQWNNFIKCLRNAMERRIKSILIISLYGEQQKFKTIQDACNYLKNETKPVFFFENSFFKYEILVNYSNGDRVEMQFRERQMAIASLMQMNG